MVKTVMRVNSLDVGVGDVKLEEPDVLEVLWVGEPAVGEHPGWEGLRLGGSHANPGPLLPLLRHSHTIHKMNGIRWWEPVEKRRKRCRFYNPILLYSLQAYSSSGEVAAPPSVLGWWC